LEAAGEWTLVQLLPWANNYYIAKGDFAKINFKSIWQNLNPAHLEWDDNQFVINQFSHPYHGSLYFNSFRSNGYNFWESSIATLAGSLTWETMGETFSPSSNDLINTTFGGIAIGEATNRLSKIILRKKVVKPKAFINESLAFMINPMQGLNRVIDGDFGKPYKSINPDNTRLGFLADAGQRFITQRGKFAGNKPITEFFGRVQLQYGDPFTDLKEPFSNFSMAGEIGNSDTAVVNTIKIEGFIFGKKVKKNKTAEHVIDITLNYDFYQNSAFIYSTQHLLTNLHSRFNFSKIFQLTTTAGAGIMLLAAVPNTQKVAGVRRNYDYCSGVAFKANAEINLVNKLFYTFNSNVGIGKTISGNNLSHLFYNLESELRLILYKGIAISASRSDFILMVIMSTLQKYRIGICLTILASGIN
jgi:hypothetical protein